MSEIIFRFGTYLTDSSKVRSGSNREPERAVGFHRWFPNGETDAIFLDTGYPKASLRVWFERKHISKDPFTTEKEREDLALAETNTLSKIGLLWSGPLFGELRVNGDISKECIEALPQSNEEAIEEHREVAKTILKYWICPPLEKFIRILQFRFGHYWLTDFEGWDGRSETLSAYCRGTLQLKVSTDGGNSFRPLCLGPAVDCIDATFDTTGDSFREYISQSDWKQIPKYMRSLDASNPPLSILSKVLSSAHHSLEEKDVKYALLESITALELAIDHRFLQGLKGNKTALEKVERFTGDKNGRGGLNLPTKVVVASAFINHTNFNQIEDILSVITERNDLVHKGKNPVVDVERRIKAVLEFVVSILELDYRFVRYEAGNAEMDSATWEIKR